MRHLTPGQAAQGPFCPMEEGTAWGHTWEYMWCRADITLLEAAADKTVAMELDLGGEATLFVNGKAFGTRRAEWVSVPHHYICDNILTHCAQPGERFSLLFEVYAGHYFPDVGGCSTGPVLPGTLQDPAAEGCRSRMGRNTFGIWNENAYQLWMDVSTLSMLMDELPEDSLRASQIADGLERYTRIVDFEQPAETRDECYRQARASLRPLLECHNGSTAPLMAAVGNSHLDLAWLWPMQETHRKTARTFAAQLRLLEQYPEYRYIQSQPAAYEMCREHYPELYERIRSAVRSGRWIAEGAMYVEPDTNIPSGEALVRQLVFGKRFYRDELGIDSQVLWLPDTFGYSAVLPQLLAGCGVRYLVTQKIFWSYNEGDPFPYHYFNWKGMDGSQVVSFLPTNYTYRTDPKELCGVWKKRVQKRHLEDFLIPFGYGDGGGGPQFEMIETARRLADLEGCPRVRYSSASKFMQSLEAEGREFPEYRGELYLELHRGTLTGKQQIKKNNRMAETALHDLELVTVLAAVHSGAPACGAACRPLWETLLVNQFHDILPGSCIPEAHDESLRQTTALLEEAGRRLDAKLRPEQMGGVLNPLGFARTDTVYLPVNTAMHAPGLRTQLVELRGGARVLAVAGLRQQPFSFTPLSLCAGADEASSPFHACGNRLETPFALVRFSPGGAISSFVDRRTGRELCAGLPLNTFLSAEDVPAAWDGWDVDADCMEKLRPDGVLQSRMVAADGPVEYRVRCTWTVCGGSVVRQDIIFHADSPLVEFDTELEWHGKHRLLKAAFDTTVQAPAARQEIQFGCIQRPTTRNDSLEQAKFEVCCHKYADLSEPSYGVALLNDCKYGVSVEGGRIALSLAKGGMRPDPRGDEGVYTFRYAFLPHTGGFCAQSVARPA